MKVIKYKWNLDAPLVIAHRGASLVAPENTLPAFQIAAQLGADGIELDVKLSSDGELIVFHDQTLERTTNGEGLIADWAWADLQQLDAGSHQLPKFKGVHIPRLKEVFKVLGDSLLYNLELTEYRRPLTQITRKTIELVDEFGLQANVLYSSFNPLALIQAIRHVRKDQIALLMHQATPAFIRVLSQALVPHAVFHPNDKLVTEKLVRRLKQSGKRINIWTVNQSERMKTLLTWGVNGLITDDPELALLIRSSL